jgi:hypothetical protein
MATKFNTVVSSSASDSQITTQGDTALVTKGFADSSYLPVTVATNNPTSLDLGQTAGTYYTDATSTTATYTVQNVTAGGFAYVNVTATSEPSVTGATKMASPTYAQPMKMVVYNDGNTTYYYFLEI